MPILLGLLLSRTPSTHVVLFFCGSSTCPPHTGAQTVVDLCCLSVTATGPSRRGVQSDKEYLLAQWGSRDPLSPWPTGNAPVWPIGSTATPHFGLCAGAVPVWATRLSCFPSAQQGATGEGDKTKPTIWGKMINTSHTQWTSGDSLACAPRCPHDLPPRPPKKGRGMHQPFRGGGRGPGKEWHPSPPGPVDTAQRG